MHSADPSITSLRDDIARWRGQLDRVAPTHRQGIASSASKRFEALVKLATVRLVDESGADVGELLQRIHYDRPMPISRLPLGTVVQLLIETCQRAPRLSPAQPVLKALPEVVKIRNDTTHELEPDEMREATALLLDRIESVLDDRTFAELVGRP